VPNSPRSGPKLPMPTRGTPLRLCFPKIPSGLDSDMSLEEGRDQLHRKPYEQPPGGNGQENYAVKPFVATRWRPEQKHESGLRGRFLIRSVFFSVLGWLRG